MTITFAPPGGEPRAVRINRGTLLQLLDQGRLRLLEDGTFTLDDDDESDDDDDDDAGPDAPPTPPTPKAAVAPPPPPGL